MSCGNMSNVSLANITSSNQFGQNNKDGNCITVLGIFLIIGYTAVLVIGVGGNFIVLCTFKKYRQRGPIFELLILYLAFFNLISSFIDPLVFGYWIITCYQSWHFGWFVCKIVPSLCRIFSNVSIGIILIMAIDRCRGIVFPFRKKLTRTKVHLLVMLTIIIGLGSEIHHIIGSFINECRLCKIVDVKVPGYLYPSIISICMRMLLIVFVFSFTTLLAYIKLKNAGKERLLLHNNQSCTSLNNRCRKVTFMLVVMSAVFSVTVLPRDIFHLAYISSWADGKGFILTTEVRALNNTLKLLQTSNVIYNVFIYARMHESFSKQKIYQFFKNKKPSMRILYRTKSVMIHTEAQVEAHV